MQELNAWVEAQKKQRSTQRVREMSVKRDHTAEIVSQAASRQVAVYLSARGQRQSG